MKPKRRLLHCSQRCQIQPLWTQTNRRAPACGASGSHCRHPRAIRRGSNPIGSLKNAAVLKPSTALLLPVPATVVTAPWTCSGGDQRATPIPRSSKRIDPRKVYRHWLSEPSKGAHANHMLCTSRALHGRHHASARHRLANATTTEISDKRKSLVRRQDYARRTIEQHRRARSIQPPSSPAGPQQKHGAQRQDSAYRGAQKEPQTEIQTDNRWAHTTESQKYNHTRSTRQNNLTQPG